MITSNNSSLSVSGIGGLTIGPTSALMYSSNTNYISNSNHGLGSTALSYLSNDTKTILSELEKTLNYKIERCREEIKSLTKEEIKLYRIHKEGEIVGLIKAKNDIKSILDTL